MAKILIVEDEAHIRTLLTMWVERHGYETVTATNGRVALEIIDSGPIDAIISDMNMPELDGLGLAKAVREDRGIDVPILLLTARCDQANLSERFEPYRVQLYPKPFMPSRLMAALERALEVAAT